MVKAGSDGRKKIRGQFLCDSREAFIDCYLLQNIV